MIVCIFRISGCFVIMVFDCFFVLNLIIGFCYSLDGSLYWINSCARVKPLIEAGKQALRNINSLALFLNIEDNPRPDETSEGGIIVEIKVKEMDQKTADFCTEWSILPGRGGYPALVLYFC
jgi:hypothetical protein